MVAGSLEKPRHSPRGRTERERRAEMGMGDKSRDQVCGGEDRMRVERIRKICVRAALVARGAYVGKQIGRASCRERVS